MRIWSRSEQKYIEEQEYKKELLDFLYHTVPGRAMLKTVTNPMVSEINAWKERLPSSVGKIKPFVEQYHIDLSECERKNFRSFDDFFTRKRPYHTDAGEDELIAVADARLIARPVSEGLILRVKNSSYTLRELVGCEYDMTRYEGGTCLIYRLAMEDYHRYVYLDEGRVGKQVSIPGQLHTIRPVSIQCKAYSSNHRICTRLHTVRYGDVLQIEVGALMVGKIQNHPAKRFVRLQEKGYFRHGGSTILQFFEPGVIALDEDIRTQSMRGTECLVHIGETIGKRLNAENYQQNYRRNNYW